MLNTTLERILVPERERRRADESTGAGFAIPALGERPVEEDQMPIWVTNMRVDLVPVRLGSAKTARYGFSEILPEQEPLLLQVILRQLLKAEQTQPSLRDACLWMQAQDLEPCHAVVPYDQLLDVCDSKLSRDEADQTMSQQGHIGKVVGGVKVIAADIQAPLVVAHPQMAGYYTRSDDRLGIMLTRFSSAWCTVSSW